MTTYRAVSDSLKLLMHWHKLLTVVKLPNMQRFVIFWTRIRLLSMHAGFSGQLWVCNQAWQYLLFLLQVAEDGGPKGDDSGSDSDEKPQKKKKRRKGEKGGGITKKQSHKDASFFADLL